jgi:hypothetical protein
MKQFLKASRKKCTMKLSIQGPSGAGKTLGALRVAKGLTGNLEKVAVIDTENGSSHLYSQIGGYSVLSMEAPYSPEMFIDAINTAIKAGFECIIIDSLSHEWFGSGGILDIHSHMEGNSFTNWSKLTPRHNALIQTIVNAPVHIIATLRSKTEYVIQQKNGKSIPEKVGMKAIQRDDSEYEFTIAFEVNKYHLATISKDRTGLFKDEVEFQLSEKIGERIRNWCTLDDSVSTMIVRQQLLDCNDLEELDRMIQENPEAASVLRDDISIKTEDLIVRNQIKFRQNGNVQH